MKMDSKERICCCLCLWAPNHLRCQPLLSPSPSRVPELSDDKSVQVHLKQILKKQQQKNDCQCMFSTRDNGLNIQSEQVMSDVIDTDHKQVWCRYSLTLCLKNRWHFSWKFYVNYSCKLFFHSTHILQRSNWNFSISHQLRKPLLIFRYKRPQPLAFSPSLNHTCGEEFAYSLTPSHTPNHTYQHATQRQRDRQMLQDAWDAVRGCLSQLWSQFHFWQNETALFSGRFVSVLWCESVLCVICVAFHIYSSFILNVHFLKSHLTIFLSLLFSSVFLLFFSLV